MFRPNTVTLALLVGGLVAFSPLSTDMYVPAFPALTESFGTEIGLVTLTLSLYLWAFAFSQLIYGPLSDRYGRKPALLAGLTLYVVTSIACALAPNIETLIVARFFQAIGACAGQVIGRAIIRDLHDGTAATKMLAYITVLMGATSMISPVSGGYLSVWLGWRAIFWFLTAYGIVFTLIIALGWKESNKNLDRNAIQPARTLRTFGSLLRDRVFTSYTISLSFFFAALFTYISSGPFVFIGVFGLEPQQFGLVFTAIASVFITSSMIMGRISHRVNVDRIYARAIVAAAFGGILMGIVSVSAYANIYTIVASFMIVTFSFGFMMPVSFSSALAPHAKIAGSASSLMGFLNSMFGAFAGALIGVLFNDTAGPTGIMIGVYCFLGMASYFILRPRAKSESQQPA
jgi:DHA1 family bicyclomycin/chloramphenicol resistance-like MFS transporter